MNILNINSYYYSSSVHSLLRSALSNCGVDTINYVPIAQNYVPRDECKLNHDANVINSKCYKNLDRYFFHLKHKKILNDINQRLSSHDYNCIHAHSLFSNGYIAMKTSEKTKTPYIVAVRDTDLNVFFKYMFHLRRLGIRILEKADRIVFLSKTYKNTLLKKYVPVKLQDTLSKKSIIIPNGIDEFWLKNKAQPKILKDRNTVKILYVGAVQRRKNLITTAKAIEILNNKGINVVFTVVGKVVDQNIYKKVISFPNVIYREPVQKEELIKIYRNNDIFVMPSITETFGLVYAEAMSQGLPVIYTKEQGFDGQFEEGVVGYHVNCFDIYEISNRIEDIINNYSKISKNCIQKADAFDWNKIAQEYIKVYKKIV